MFTTVDQDRVTTTFTLLTIAIVFCQFFPCSTSSCDVSCTCQRMDNGSHVICRHLGSTTVFPDDVLRLKIENDTFPNDVITNVTFPPLQHLRHLAIIRCGITNITRDAFVRFELLQVLVLSYNLISDLDLRSFEGLSYVRKIFLNGNRLVHLPEGLFRELDLDLLDLSDNRFVTIPGNSFAGSAVRSLNLNLNSIAFAEDSNFFWLRTSLRELTISDNRCFLRLHNASISHLNLTRLRLTHSQINGSSFLVNSTVTEVDISGNVLSSDLLWKSLRLSETEILYARNLSLANLPIDSLASLPSARILDFSENRLGQSMIRPETFRSNLQLQHLNLAHNRIGRLAIDFGRFLGNLTTLNLSGNALRFLYDDFLVEVTRLEILDLSGNRLQFISEATFLLSSVVTRLEDNPLHCNCQLLWLRRWLQRNENDTASSASSAAVTCASPFAGPLVSDNVSDQLNCSSPSLDPLPSTLNVTEGDDLLLSCFAMADPLASITWFNDDDAPLMSVTPSITQDRSVARTSATLKLKRVSQHDAGSYVCNAANLIGSTTATVTVNVLRRSTTTSDVITSSVEQELLAATSSERLRNTMSADSLPVTITSIIGQMNKTEVKETAVNADSTTSLSETTEFYSANRQNDTDHLKTDPDPQRTTMTPAEESFTIQLEIIRRSTETEAHSRKSTEGFTNFTSSTLFVYISSTSANVSNSSDNFRSSTTQEVGRTTQEETWKTTTTENELRNDSVDNKGEAKLFPVSYKGAGIAGGLPVVGIMLAFVGLVVLFGIGIFCWSKKRRRCGQYKVGPSPPERRSAEEELDLRSYDNGAQVTQSSVDSIESVKDASDSSSSDPWVAQNKSTSIRTS